jgi:hypothetical protein
VRPAFGTRKAGHTGRDSAFVLARGWLTQPRTDHACDESRITNAECRALFLSPP